MMMPPQTPIPSQPLVPELEPAPDLDQGGASLLSAAIRRHAQKALASLGLARPEAEARRHSCDIDCADAIKAELIAGADPDPGQP